MTKVIKRVALVFVLALPTARHAAAADLQAGAAKVSITPAAA